jgi:AraC-like DNA-binding protein
LSAKSSRRQATKAKEMPGSLSSVFGEPEDFLAALHEDGVAGLLITGRGRFRARLTRITLLRLRLAAVEEELARTAFVAVPAGAILVSLPNSAGPSPVWGGIATRAGDMITLGPDQRVHARTDGPSRWAAIRMPEQDLVHYSRALSGAGFVVPPVARWRPPPAAARDLRHLYRSAVRMAEARSGALTDVEAAHGLEQQLIHALIECFSGGPNDTETPAAGRHREILARFEDLLQAEPFGRVIEICAALGVSTRTLRICCEEQLGMGPTEYVHRRRMQLVHRALRHGNPGAASISAAARRYGFRALGRFAAHYRAVYGELPSATLRRGARRELRPSRRRRPRGPSVNFL